MSAQDEMERPAKQWQVAAIQKDLQRLNEKADRLIDMQSSYVTTQELKDFAVQQQKFVVDQVTVVKTKYDPIYRMFWALMTGVVIETAVLVLQLRS